VVRYLETVVMLCYSMLCSVSAADSQDVFSFPDAVFRHHGDAPCLSLVPPVDLCSCAK